MRQSYFFNAALIGGAAAFVIAFFVLPMIQLAWIGGIGEDGLAEYLLIFTTPRHTHTMTATLFLALGVTAATLVVAKIISLFLSGRPFPGQSLLIALLTLPLAFPGIVVGFLVILLAGRQGLANTLAGHLGLGRVVFAHSLWGLFLGYLYFSIPRVPLTVMAGIDKIGTERIEAARSLGASRWQVLRGVMLPALKPAFFASGSVAFATAMGAFATAFSLAASVDVLPMVINTEFTQMANFASAAALSIILGLITWATMSVARRVADPNGVLGA